MGWIILAIVVILVIAIISMYNGLVSARVKVDNAWSQIDVQLQRRFDLIPNFVETVKGYAAHESETFEKITKLELLGQVLEQLLKKLNWIINFQEL